jgi:3-deoxy-7-phosphoheptulonate synthase
MASGLSMPVGFKNATDGGLQAALDAMVSARHHHAFLGIDANGHTAIVRTMGNPDVHLVLRGGGGRTNFSKPDIAYTKAMLDNQHGERNIMVDCSHGNSNKDYRRQPDVFRNLVAQYRAGETTIVGMMLESNIVAGQQKLADPKSMVYGQSITDSCIDWEQTESLFLET